MDENEQKALDAAMDFISFAHKRGYPFSGNVFFTVNDSVSGRSIQKTVCVVPTEVRIEEGCVEPLCSVVVEKDVLLLMLSGGADPMSTVLSGQVQVDNIMILGMFASAFEFSRDSFTRYVQSKQSPVANTNDDSEEEAVIIVSELIQDEDSIQSINQDGYQHPSNGNYTSLLLSGGATVAKGISVLVKDMDRVATSVRQAANSQELRQISDNISQTVQKLSQSPQVREAGAKLVDAGSRVIGIFKTGPHDSQARQTEKERLEAKLAELRNQREKKSQEKVIKAKEAQEQMKRKREQDQDAEMNRVLALSRLMSLKENIETTILGLREEINQEQDFPHFVRHAGALFGTYSNVTEVLISIVREAGMHDGWLENIERENIQIKEMLQNNAQILGIDFELDE